MSTARQRPPRAKQDSNNDEPTLTARASSSDSISHRSNRVRRRKLSVAVVTATSVLLVLVLVLARRMWILISFHHDDDHGGTTTTHDNESNPKDSSNNNVPSSSFSLRPILTAYLEPPDTLQTDDIHPLPPRKTSASLLTKVEYPQVLKCSKLTESWPVNDFSSYDPFLPWIHSIFPSHNGTSVTVVAQNKRRCHVGDNANMKHWEPQIALFQPIPVTYEDGHYRLSSVEEAMWKETRFFCHFHSSTRNYNTTTTTLSQFPFNYEYVSWRKGKTTMFEKEGKDHEQFWLSQLLFFCPIPEEFQTFVKHGKHMNNDDESNLWLDLIPIRTPARFGQFLLTDHHVGNTNSLPKIKRFNTTLAWGDHHHVLPSFVDSGRWANIPICQTAPPVPPEKRHLLVVCTWTAASYTRRGDAVTMNDTPQRLREWILFHQMVGVERLYVYDNTVGTNNNNESSLSSPLAAICSEFELCVYQPWPARVCNNNRPNHAHPGERSSQYAAEADCRERYGPTTEWMAFIDTDEYLVPMKSDTWKDVLDDMDARGIKILKMRSARTKPRLEYMEVSPDQSTCVDPQRKRSKFQPQPCVVPRTNETFLRVYNCDYIRPPRPDRFARAMKQIYRPLYVWNHFVHYSTVTADVARLASEYGPNETYIPNVHSRTWEEASPEVFLDEVKEGTLVHTKTVLPHETMYRGNHCQLNSTVACALGFECPAHVEFSDQDHAKNIFQNNDGEYCNCWINPRVEHVFVPKLKAALQDHFAKRRNKK